MVDYNIEYANSTEHPEFPMGESWILGDTLIVGALIEDHRLDYDRKPAPRVTMDMFFVHQHAPMHCTNKYGRHIWKIREREGKSEALFE